jgi:hypothetical protein
MKSRSLASSNRDHADLDFTANYAEAETRALYFAISRDFRRAALFLWITPLLATRSSMLTAARVAACAVSGSPAAIATSAFLTKVRADVRNGLLRAARRAATRIRFFADFELANRHIPPKPDSKNYPITTRRAHNRTKSRAVPPAAVNSFVPRAVYS